VTKTLVTVFCIRRGRLINREYNHSSHYPPAALSYLAATTIKEEYFRHLLAKTTVIPLSILCTSTPYIRDPIPFSRNSSTGSRNAILPRGYWWLLVCPFDSAFASPSTSIDAIDSLSDISKAIPGNNGNANDAANTAKY